MILGKLLMTASLIAAASTSVAAMQWQKRVLLVSAPQANDPARAEQRRIVAGWKAGAVERDLAVVEIVGDRVLGASDAPAALRQRYGLSSAAFGVVLIGKDGGVKLRQTRPIPAAILEETIDAMPMRRAGKR
ncbi:DUF4174 domain-containing protein [Sphingomonas sp. HT-1]|uniref:DUF4174 domain-containing protein n=1 Tax=unclassified Sphingomonas TaxID=196159 RepID=UPI0003653025|nr:MULTISPECIES: DUF4174 domain-containing protein [unclassified Sphingomonas]